MGEAVGPIVAEDEFLTQRLPEVGFDLLRRGLVDHAERFKTGGVAEAGEVLQRSARSRWKSRQLAHHQVDDVVRVALGERELAVPGPVARRMVEREQVLFRQGMEELDREERVTRGLRMDEPGQR